jgi:hypothetical protein
MAMKAKREGAGVIFSSDKLCEALAARLSARRTQLDGE